MLGGTKYPSHSDGTVGTFALTCAERPTRWTNFAYGSVMKPLSGKLFRVQNGRVLCASLFLLLGFSSLAELRSAPRVDAAIFGGEAFEGTVGKAKVIMVLNTSSQKLVGSYFYRSNGLDIGVSGTAAKLDEINPNTITNYEKAVTGTFSGVFSADRQTYKGTWKSATGSKSAAFALKSIGSSNPGVAQSVRVTKQVKQAKSKLGLATYRFPVIVGTKPDWIAARINADIKNRSLADETLARVTADFESNGSGITGIDYQVNHNANSLLDITTSIETMGAYPDQFKEYLVYDVRSGARVHPADVFSSFNPIRLLIQKQVKARIAEAKAADPGSVEDLNLMLGENPGSVDDDTLESFTITKTGAKTGLTFHYLFGFVHAGKALEPNGDVFLSWAELKPFLRSDGLLTPLAQ